MNLRRSIRRATGRSQTGPAVWCLLALGLCGALFGQQPQNRPSSQNKKPATDFGANKIVNRQKPAGSQPTANPQKPPSSQPTALPQKPPSTQPTALPQKPPSTQPTATVTPQVFALVADAKAPSQGQLVHFTLQPPPQNSFGFIYNFDDRDIGEPTESTDGTLWHRFVNAGPHKVTVTPKPALYSMLKIGPSPLPQITLPVTVSPLALTLTPQGPSLLVDQEVTLSTQDLQGTDILYRFFFDASKKYEEVLQPSITHQYNEPGEYAPHVDIVLKINGREQTISSPSQTVTIRRPNKVTLSINAAGARVDEQVFFTANYVPGDSHPGTPEYQFTFGDGQLSEWLSNSSTSHQYQSAGTYHVVVEVRDGRTNSFLAKSDPPSDVAIRSNDGGIDPKLPIGIAIVIFGAGLSAAVYKWWRRPPKAPASIPSSPPIPPPVSQPPMHQMPMPHPTVVLHTDRDAPPDQKPRLSLGLQVNFNSRIGNSHTRLTTEGESLIRSERRDV